MRDHSKNLSGKLPLFKTLCFATVLLLSAGGGLYILLPGFKDGSAEGSLKFDYDSWNTPSRFRNQRPRMLSDISRNILIGRTTKEEVLHLLGHNYVPTEIAPNSSLTQAFQRKSSRDNFLKYFVGQFDTPFESKYVFFEISFNDHDVCTEIRLIEVDI